MGLASRVEQRNQFGLGFNPLHPFEYARALLLAMALPFPTLRSDILVVGQKPTAVGATAAR